MARPITLHATSAIFASAIIVAAPAMADRRTPAPIEYAGTGQGAIPRANPDASRDPWRGPVTRTGSVNLPQAREKISFSYPGAAGSAPSQMPRELASLEEPPKASAPAKLWPAEAAAPVQTARQTLTLGAAVEAAPAAQASQPVKPLAASVMPDERGLASWYGADFHGQPTANGETFDMNAMSAAHRTLPLPSLVQVINEENGKEVVVRVNDRGPFAEGRVIDVSKRAAAALGFTADGVAPVTVRYLGPAPAAGMDAPQQVAEQPTQPAVEVASLDPVAPPRPNLYGEMLLGGVEPSLGIPDPGQSVATPARLASAPAKPQQQASAPRVVEAGLPSAEAAPVRQVGRPQPTSVAQTPPRPAATAFGPQIFVQVGAFADISNAQGMNARVGAGFPTDIESVRVNGADYFRVFVGPYHSRGEAERAKVQLGVRGVRDSFVVVR